MATGKRCKYSMNGHPYSGTMLWAARGGHKNIIALLNESQIHYNESSDYTLPKQMTSKVAILKFLNEQDMAYRDTETSDVSSMLSAAQRSNADDMKYNHENGTPYTITNHLGFTAMHFAAMDGRIANMKFLHQQGIPYDVKSNSNVTPMDIAVIACQLSTVEFLQQPLAGKIPEIIDSNEDTVENIVEDSTVDIVEGQCNDILQVFNRLRERCDAKPGWSLFGFFVSADNQAIKNLKKQVITLLRENPNNGPLISNVQSDGLLGSLIDYNRDGSLDGETTSRIKVDALLSWDQYDSSRCGCGPS